MNKKSKGRVVIPLDIVPYPEKHEVTAARLLAGYFRTDILFIPRRRYRTPDFLIDDQFWELKSPTGNGKHTIQHNLQTAIKQAPNIIYDSRGAKMRQDKIKRDLRAYIAKTAAIRRFVLITKDNQIIELETVWRS